MSDDYDVSVCQIDRRDGVTDITNVYEFTEEKEGVFKLARMTQYYHDPDRSENFGMYQNIPEWVVERMQERHGAKKVYSENFSIRDFERTLMEAGKDE